MEQWIIDVITAFGTLGIFFLMLAENLFPPIPSEVIVPVAGLAVGAGQLGLLPVVLAALAGTGLALVALGGALVLVAARRELAR